MDRVKGAVFDSLGERLDGARVLDLFAGAGSLGIEALSRGAASAVLVEKEVRAVETIHRNLAKTRLAPGATVIASDVFSYLHRRALPGAFDLIFADPPYPHAPGDRDFGAELLGEPALARALAADGLFILEKRPGTRLPEKSGWELLRERRYGATAVALYRRTAP